jgi:hypothetical protein
LIQPQLQFFLPVGLLLNGLFFRQRFVILFLAGLAVGVSPEFAALRSFVAFTHGLLDLVVKE